MVPPRFFVHTFATVLFAMMGLCLTATGQTKVTPPIIIATDLSWDVSSGQTQFGEYPLSAEQIASPTSTLSGGTRKAVAAEFNERSRIIPGSIAIWRNRTADDEGEAYHFRKTVPLGSAPIQKITLEINSDDVARVYINQRLASAEKRDGKLKDGYDRWFLFRSVSGFMYDRIYTYDVTDFFFTNVTNTILIEAASMAFDGSHAYLSAKIVIEFAPEPVRPPAPAKPKPPTKPKPSTPPTAKPDIAKPAPASPEKTVFEADNFPEIEALHVGSILELGHVHFTADDYALDSTSYRTLSALASFLQRHPSLKIEVGGHTNLRPSERFAAELSANRARSVVHYLTERGIAAERVTHKGYGKSQPRIKAVSKIADAANQRVEIKVLAK